MHLTQVGSNTLSFKTIVQLKQYICLIIKVLTVDVPNVTQLPDDNSVQVSSLITNMCLK